MSIAALIRRMTEAGATPEAIALAVEAIEAIQAKDDERKAKQRERTAKHRAKSRDSNVTVTHLSQSEDGQKNVPSDSPKENTTPPSHPTDAQTPQGVPGTDAQGAEVVQFPKAKARSESRGTRLPADWKPTPDLIEFARQEGLTDEQISRELARFRDYWLQATGSRATKRDWGATFRNWIREAVDRLRRFSRPAAGGHGSQAPSMLRAYKRAAARFADPDAFPE